MADHRDFINPATGELDTAGLIAAFDQKCDELTAVEYEDRKKARANLALRRELSKMHADDPKSKQIREVMEYWIVKCHKTKATKIPIDGIRAQKVRARLNQDFTIEDLKLAIDGGAAKPFVGPRGRVGTQEPGTRREDDLELILRDEKNVERFQSYAKEAARQPAKPPLELVADDDDPDRGGVIHVTDVVDGARVDTPIPVTVRDQQRHERQLRERTEDYRIHGDQRPPIDRVIEAAHTTTGHFPTPSPGSNDSWMSLCPSHDDRSPSMRITRSPEGTVLFYCLAGCDNDQIIRDLGLDWRDLWDNADRDMNALYYVEKSRGPGRERKAELADALRQIQSTLVQWGREEAA